MPDRRLGLSVTAYGSPDPYYWSGYESLRHPDQPETRDHRARPSVFFLLVALMSSWAAKGGSVLLTDKVCGDWAMSAFI